MAEGRGLDHLSAALEEGDLVLYQVGSWTVDGVVVGPGDEPELAYAVVDTLQLVFTRNCEHGWIYGSRLECDDSDGSLRVPEGDAFVQLGPEQLLARLDGEARGDGDDSYELGDAGRRAVEEARVWGLINGEIKHDFVSLGVFYSTGAFRRLVAMPRRLRVSEPDTLA